MGGKGMNVILKSISYDLYNKENKVIGKENKIKAESSKKDVLKDTVEKMKQALEKNGFKTEEDKKKFESKLNEKIKSGARLSQKEMDYLRRTNPTMYTRVKRVQMQREMLESRLKQCKSKKEVEETYNQAMAGIHKKDPDKELVMSAYNNVTKEFKSTREYKELPPDIEDKKKGKSIFA